MRSRHTSRKRPNSIAIGCALALTVVLGAPQAQGEIGRWEKRASATATMQGLANTSLSWWGGPGAGVLAFGGSELVTYGPTNLLWRWTGESWEGACRVAPCKNQMPPRREYHALAYDPQRDRLVLFGGSDGGLYMNDTWEFDGTQWQEACLGECKKAAPSPRAGHAMAYDGASQSVVMFGGASTEVLNDPEVCFRDTWHWDGLSWKLVQAQGVIDGRVDALLAFDTTRQHLVLFGGSCSQGVFTKGPMWEWDGQTWSPIYISKVPSARLGSIFVPDPRRSKIVLFGGWDQQYSAYDDTWQWDGTAWEKLKLDSVAPSARHESRAAFDEARGRLVLHGGEIGVAKSNAPNADTWELVVFANPCSSEASCDTGFCSEGLCCLTACDGACETCQGESPGTCETLRDTTSSRCNGTKRCGVDGACASLLGQPCEKGSHCLSKSCVGQVCCALSDCGGFACGSDGACKTHCTSEADCVSGFRCAASGVCEAKASCDGDHTVLLPGGATQDCFPYRCTLEGACSSECRSQGDCVVAHMCSAASRCVPTSDFNLGELLGRCSAAARTRPQGAACVGLGLLALLGIGVLRRSRRGS